MRTTITVSTSAKAKPGPTDHSQRRLTAATRLYAGRVRPEREQAGDGYRILAVEEIAVDLQEIREQEGTANATTKPPASHAQ